jgi:hypothetical protein
MHGSLFFFASFHTLVPISAKFDVVAEDLPEEGLERSEPLATISCSLLDNHSSDRTEASCIS